MANLKRAFGPGSERASKTFARQYDQPVHAYRN